MASDTVVRARIDGQVKERAAKVLADMGLSVSDAIRLLLVRVAAEKALPFEVKVPNSETRAAIAEVERGEGESFDSVTDLIADLECEELSALPDATNAQVF
jgi:DNA-damage-inducible protein J